MRHLREIPARSANAGRRRGRPQRDSFPGGPGRTVRNREEFGAGATAGRVRCACGSAASQLRFLLEMLRDGISRPGPVPGQVRLGRVTARPGFGMSVHPETAPSGAVSHRRRAAAPPRPCGRRRCRRQYRGPRQAKTQRAATRCAPMQGRPPRRRLRTGGGGSAVILRRPSVRRPTVRKERLRRRVR